MRVSSGKKPKNKGVRNTSQMKIEEKVVRGSQSIGISNNPKRVVPEEKGKVETELDIKKEEKIIPGNILEKEIVEGRKSRKLSSTDNTNKLTKGRIFGMVLVGLVSSLMLSMVVWSIYYGQVRYPVSAYYDIDSSGLGAINRWVDSINTLDGSAISGITGEGSYLAKEVEYANGKDYQVEFVKKMISTVSYKPDKVIALNKYGNPLVDKEDNVVYMDSLVNGIGEEVSLSYVDYSKVILDKEKIKNLMKESNLALGDVDYSNTLVEVFCKYMLSLEDESIPLITTKYTPNLIQGSEGYTMTVDEDVYLDRVLFSSEEFHNLLHRFSLVAGSGEENPEWVKWNKLPKKKKKRKEEPIRYFEELQPTEAWTKWSNLPESKKAGKAEPVKYDPLNMISFSWCGSYYLLNEYSVKDENGNVVNIPIGAEIGDGSLKNPAGLNTGVVTSIFVLEKSKKGEEIRVAEPVRVRLVDFKVSQKAIDYFEGKDERNRGFDVKSEIQYANYSFEVTNLSDKTITVYDDSSLSDGLANMSPRTGIIYGLQDSVELRPQETGIIESWGCSTELNKKYLIWGKDFQREKPVVWFRVLSGNIDDPSEDKGVTLNNSRYENNDTGGDASE